MVILMDTTANRLKRAMEIRNMKAIDLHDKTGIGKSSISQYMNGKVKPKQDRIYLMAQALNVDELWLMGHDVPMERIERAESAPPPSQPYRAELTERDERDIEKRLQAIRDDLDSESGIALLGDHPLTEDEKEQLLIPIKSGLETARLIAKKKFTPKKYQNGAAQRQNDTATRIGKKVLNASPAAQAAVSDIIRGDEKDK